MREDKENVGATRGPKPLPPEDRRSAWLKIRVRPAELEQIQQAAARLDATLSDWTRTLLLRAARRTQR